MTQPPFVPYAVRLPTTRDGDHLRVLSILHYVWGGLILLFSCFTIFYIVIGVVILSGGVKFPPPTTGPAGGPEPSPELFGWMFAGFGGCGLVLGSTLGILTIISGRRMAARRSRTFSLVMAGINCLSVPLGTTLGVFTIVVLMRDSVKAMYAEAAAVRSPAAWPPPPPPGG